MEKTPPMKRLAALLPLLSACGSSPSATSDSRIECAMGGAAEFVRACTVERTPGPDVLLTLRSPSGSSRGRGAPGAGGGVRPADGAEPASVRAIGKNLIEV